MIVGFIIGFGIAMILLLTLALCRAAARADEWQERQKNERDEDAQTS